MFNKDIRSKPYKSIVNAPSLRSSSSNKVKKSVQIDNALEQYYLEMGRSDYRHDSRDHAQGKFLAFFCDNDYDTDDIADELGEDVEAEDCSYLDFDDDFPVHASITTANQIQQEKFRILQNCYKYGMALRRSMKFEVTHQFMKNYKINGKIFPLNLDLNANDISFALQRYKKQCKKSFANKALTDNGMAYSFAVGIKNHNFPFLQCLLDMYVRDSLQNAIYYNKHISTNGVYDIHTLNDYSIQSWAEKVGLKQKIGNLSGGNLLKHRDYLKGNAYDAILSGMDKFLRVCPRLHLNPLMLIKDDIYQISEYILMSYNMVKHIIRNQSEQNLKYLNFQFDFSIACNQSVQKRGSCFPAFLQDLEKHEFSCSDDDEEDEGVQNDGHIVDGIKWTCDELADCIGGIEDRLISNDNVYVSSKLSANRMCENVAKLQQMDESEMEVLLDVCRKNLILNAKDMHKIINFSAFEYRTQDHGERSRHYDLFCDELDALKICSLQSLMDSVCPEMCIDRIIFQILDFEMAHDTVYELLSNLIEKNKAHSFGANEQIMLDMYDTFVHKLQVDKAFGYPNNSRFCAMIDRRDEKKYKYRQPTQAKPQHADTLYFFAPKQNQYLPLHQDPDVLPEWYFNAVQTSFLPKFNQGASHRHNFRCHEWSEQYMANQQKVIGSHSLCNGALLTFSWIVDSVDSIKCYLFRDSTYIRVFPDDVSDIVPKLFLKEFGNNARFATNQDNVAEIIASKMQFGDESFQYWCSNEQC
mmetsp:Transcript_47487/g.76198  ORF Transcript_47487/g.76198 Transcript_47487/m.76198 type:complete len:753 (-) Transcript_47487:200-2458(-)